MKRKNLYLFQTPIFILLLGLIPRGSASNCSFFVREPFLIPRGSASGSFIRLSNRTNATGSLKNVLISNIIATSYSLMSSSITAVPEFYVENLILRDIIINCKGGGTLFDTKKSVPECEKSYPENRMFGYSLPAYGIYIRHAKNITLDNIQFNLLQPDSRFAVWLEDAHNILIKDLITTKSPKRN